MGTQPRKQADAAADSSEGADPLETAVQMARDGVRDALASMHRHPGDIEGADAFGLFPPAVVPTVPVVVVDANVLRKDVLYSCRTGHRTVMVDAARAGLIRLFCAGHVAGEVLKHYQRWSREGKISAATFTALWIYDYAPLLRLVPESPEGLLTDEEEARIAVLRAKDPDDVPSVTLALLLGGFYLSEDGPATTAVYGERRDNDELRAWRRALSAGGDAGAISAGLEATAILVNALRGGLVELGAWATRGTSVWLKGLLLAGAVGAGGYRIYNLAPDVRQRMLDSLKHLATIGGAVAIEYTEALGRLDRAYAPEPDLGELMRQRGPNAVLHRTILQVLARSRGAWLSAAEIASGTPCVPVPHGEKKVRALLRTQSSAVEIGRGRWQLGEPLFWPEDPDPGPSWHVVL